MALTRPQLLIREHFLDLLCVLLFLTRKAHALGFGHEQSRDDRDTYVRIHWNNIIPAMKFNFEKYSKSEVNSLGKKYDYASVMHYGPYDFAKRDGLKTISSLQKGKKFGNKPKLSKLDREQARLLYKCSKGTKIPQPPTQAPMPSPSSSTIPPGSGSGSDDDSS
ncbi:zinc metallo ase nas-15-like [Paramuricea clavata]|uniref:Metalloendopeptidase n=1 Tax=Paramuricea clavata TaxID=317549 RepID=A0A7D9IK53_PARCT|nr:zinc metallo ase nas-15-like [Paramuricea clavata]